MANNYFTFKQFTVYQSDCAMKVGTDGVLLGAWASSTGKINSILDIGSGTGLLSLMLAQRFLECKIIAVEIEVLAAKQAKSNFESSPWKDRIELYTADFLTWQCDTLFDLIVSNPPYFENSLKNSTRSKTMARHTDSLPFSKLLLKAATLLAPQGSFCLVVPAQAFQTIVENAKAASLNLHTAVWIKTTPTREAKRVLLRFGGETREYNAEEIIIESNGRHQYSDEYKALTQDFYLDKV